jgi:acyl-CoA synthetase (AMP-forming)/AMP-acid ligase II
MTAAERPWLKSYEEGVPESVEFEEICLPDILDRSAQMFPDNMALLFQGYQVTYAELKEMVDRFATILAGFGIKKGDSVAILLPNLIPCVVAYYATLKIGGIAVMNNPLYSDRELGHQFNDSEAKLLVTLDLLGNRMIDLRPQTNIKEIIYTSIGDYLPRRLPSFSQESLVSPRCQKETAGRGREISPGCLQMEKAHGRDRTKTSPGISFVRRCGYVPIHRRDNRGFQGRNPDSGKPGEECSAGCSLVPGI